MVIEQIKTGHNHFFQRNDCEYNNFDNIEKFDNHFNSVHRKLYEKNFIHKTLQLTEKAHKSLVKKLRISHKKNIMDCLTFSREFIDDVDKILDVFWHVSKKNLFFPTPNQQETKDYKKDTNYNICWFSKKSLCTLQEWVVAHFEKRIYDFYVKYDKEKICKITFLEKRESFIKIWTKMELKQKQTLIEKLVDCVDTFPLSVLKTNDEELNLGNDKLSYQQKLFNILRKEKKMEISDLNSFKENMVRKIMEIRDNMGDSNFLRMCVSSNLKQAADLEYFFIAKLAFELDHLHYKLIFNLDEFEEKEKKKKKKKKTKNTQKNSEVNPNKEDIDINKQIEDKEDKKIHKKIEDYEDKEDSDKIEYFIKKEENFNLSKNEEIKNNKRIQIKKSFNENIYIKNEIMIPLLENEKKSPKINSLKSVEIKQNDITNKPKKKKKEKGLSKRNFEKQRKNYNQIKEKEDTTNTTKICYSYKKDLREEEGKEKISFKESLEEYEYFDEYNYSNVKKQKNNLKNDFFNNKKRRHSSTNFEIKLKEDDNIENFLNNDHQKTLEIIENEKLEIFYNSEKKNDFNDKGLENDNEKKELRSSKIKKKPKLKKIEKIQKNKYWDNSKRNPKKNEIQKNKNSPEKFQKSATNKLKMDNQKNNEEKNTKEKKKEDKIKEDKNKEDKNKEEKNKEEKNKEDKNKEDKNKEDKNKEDKKKSKVIIEKKVLKTISYWGDEKEIDLFKNEKKNKKMGKSLYSLKSVNQNPKSSLKFKQFSNLSLSEKQKIDNEKKKEIILKKTKKLFFKNLSQNINKVIDELKNFSNGLESQRKIIIKKIEEVTKSSFPENEIFLKEYGSYATKLLTPFSDVDLSIQHHNQFLGKNGAVKMLSILNDNLSLYEFVLETQPIFTAIVPVLKIYVDSDFVNQNTLKGNSSEFLKKEIVYVKKTEDDKSKENSEFLANLEKMEKKSDQQNEKKKYIQFDITVDISNLSFPSTPHRTTDFINFCIKNYPSFYKNILFLKYVFSYKDLSNVYKGGLNAYGLSISYVAFLLKTNQTNSTNNTELLFQFLQFLAKEFDPNKQMINLGFNFR